MKVKTTQPKIQRSAKKKYGWRYMQKLKARDNEINIKKVITQNNYATSKKS